MREVDVEYQADGLDMRSRLFVPDAAGPAPGVIVFPEVFGIGEHSLRRARRLAELGYISLAADLHGKARLLETLEEAAPVSQHLRANPENCRARARGALAALAARPEVSGRKIAAIGFCFGGTMALELARGGADIAAVTGFHSGLATQAPAERGAITGRILVCIGADDPSIPLAHRSAFEAEMRAAGASWRMELYGGVVHSFTNPRADRMDRPDFARYDAEADRISWASMQDLFEQTLR
jgi:dienelactone hydrolase